MKGAKTLWKRNSEFLYQHFIIAVFLSLCSRSGLIDGYTGERAALDEQLRQKEELQLSLEQELQVRYSSSREVEE